MCNKLSDYDGYIALAEATIKQAVDDYRAITQGIIEENKYVNKSEIEKFFRSELGDLLCQGHGEEVLGILKRG